MDSPDGTLDAAFFEEMVETVGVGVAIYGADGVYRYVNQAYAEMLATDRDALVGTPLWEVVAAFDGDRFEDYWASFDTGETRTARAEHRFGDRTVPVSTVTTRRRIDGTDYNFGTIQDISELVAREAELEEKNERLEAFAGIVAHDLRNPLNVAHSHLELLQQDVQRREVEMLDSALTRMEILIEDLLTLAKQGGDAAEPTPVDIATVATAAWETVATGDGALLTPDGVTVLADHARLRQLFENLFRNSVEHGTDGVTVGLGATADGEGFYVEDDGPGIPAERRQQVFEPGYTQSEDGTGFGLTIVSEAAKAHGWTVEATESDAGGARFEFRGVEFPERD